MQQTQIGSNQPLVAIPSSSPINSFSSRLAALEGVEEVLYSVKDTEVMVPCSRGEYALDVPRLMRITPDTEERMVVLDRYVVAAGLKFDQDHSSPLEEGTANGNIYHYDPRRGSKAEQKEFFAAVGLDSGGNKDLTLDAVIERLAKVAVKKIGDDLHVFTTFMRCLQRQSKPMTKDSLEKAIAQAIWQRGFEGGLTSIAQNLFDVPSWEDIPNVERFQSLADFLVDENLPEKCWDDLVSEGKVGNPLAVMLDIYEHSGIFYSITGRGMKDRFDTSRGAAVWVPDANAVDAIKSRALSALNTGEVKWFGACGSKTDPLNARYTHDGKVWVGEGKGWTWYEAQEAMIASSGITVGKDVLAAHMRTEAEKYCQGVLKVYNDYANGEVYGVLCYVIDRATSVVVEESEIWGFYGREGAEEELETLITEQVMVYGKRPN